MHYLKKEMSIAQCADNTNLKTKYRVILKKVSLGIFRTILVIGEEKNFTIKSKDKGLSKQVFMIFGHGQRQNHQN